MIAATPLAADAEAVGEAIGSIVPLALGIILLVIGLRRRKASAASSTWQYSAPMTPPAAPGWGVPTAGPLARGPVGTPWTPADQPADPVPPEQPQSGWPPPSPPPGTAQPLPAWPTSPPPPTATKARGTGLIVAGAIIAGLGLLGLAARAATFTTITERQVALPASVLGLDKDEAASATIGASALQGAPKELIDPQAALYGRPGQGIAVIAARVHTRAPSRELDNFRAGFEENGQGRLTDGRDVDTGVLGGAARCWAGDISGTKASICVFVDGGSLLATIDFLAGSVDDAAGRGLTIREATVHKT